MGSQEPETEGLADRISKLYIKSHDKFGGGEFLPAGKYKDPTLLNAAVVREELELESGEDGPLVNFIFIRAPKIFLVIVCLNWPAGEARRFMQHFIDHGFVNENLPANMEFCNQHATFSLKSWKPGP